jgi:putative ABC transport system permease protein
MVVAVFVMTLALAQGFRATLVASGSPDNAIVLLKGATSESTSGFDPFVVPIVETLPQIARDAHGSALVSPELVAAIALPRVTDGQDANVPVRGVGPHAFEIRERLRIVEGRPFTRGLNEVNVGRLATARFRGLGLGGQLQIGGRPWTVVGIFTVDDASFESEIWGDVDLLNPAFQRQGYQSLTARLVSRDAFASFAAAIGSDRRFRLEAQREPDYYAAQSRVMTTVISVLGTFVTAILAIGAMFGAMNTMYAAVAHRIREVGTLRALGFSRTSILLAFIFESTVLAVIGGAIGCVLALPLHGMSTGTTNMASFTEVAFNFRITVALLVGGVVFAAVMGALGGLLPAIRAARLPISQALREI